MLLLKPIKLLWSNVSHPHMQKVVKMVQSQVFIPMAREVNQGPNASLSIRPVKIHVEFAPKLVMNIKWWFPWVCIVVFSSGPLEWKYKGMIAVLCLLD